MFRKVCGFLVLLSGFFAFTVPDRDMIEWTPDARLTWKEYKAKVPDSTDHSTASSCGIYCIPQVVGDSAFVTVIAYFDRNKSWRRKNR